MCDQKGGKESVILCTFTQRRRGKTDKQKKKESAMSRCKRITDEIKESLLEFTKRETVLSFLIAINEE